MFTNLHKGKQLDGPDYFSLTTYILFSLDINLVYLRIREKILNNLKIFFQVMTVFVIGKLSS